MSTDSDNKSAGSGTSSPASYSDPGSGPDDAPHGAASAHAESAEGRNAGDGDGDAASVSDEEVVVVITNSPMPRESSRHNRLAGGSPGPSSPRLAADAHNAIAGPAAQPAAEGSVFAEAAPATYGEFDAGEPVMGIPIGIAPAHDNDDDGGGRGGPGFIAGRAVPLHRPEWAFGTAGADDEAETMTLCWAMSRTIRLWASMDVVIVAVWLMIRLWFAALVPFPVIGYVGARRFQPRLMLLYLCYFPVVVPLRGWVAYLGAQEAERETVAAVYYGLGAIGILMELWLAHRVRVAYRAFGLLTPEQRSFLIAGWSPTDDDS